MVKLRGLGPAILAGTLSLAAQDAGMVLRTSVSYRTMQNSLNVSGERKQATEKLYTEAQQANRDGKYDEAIRALYHGISLMRGVEWTPSFEWIASLQGHLDHGVAAPGDSVTVTLTPLFKEASVAGIHVTAAVALVSRGKPEKLLQTKLPIDPAALPFSVKAAIPSDAAGDYAIEVRLATEGETLPPVANTITNKSLPVHVERLAADAAKLRARLAKLAGNSSPALPTAAYVLDFYDRADHGEVSPAGFHYQEEFARANEILDAIDASKDPFAGKRGDFRDAYLSAVDHTLQPYRILIPAAYDAAKAAPLVVALHGMGGDENSIFDSYGGAFKPAAEHAGLIAVCPKGRDSASMYRGSAEQDVLDVIAQVRRAYNIDPNRIYLMGHSMGGYGTWSVAMDHPELFAALGPISGGGNPGGMAKIAAIPEFVVHGDADPTVPVAQSRAMVEAGKKAGANIRYVEVPGGNHNSVVAPNFAPMLDYFATLKK